MYVSLHMLVCARTFDHGCVYSVVVASLKLPHPIQNKRERESAITCTITSAKQATQTWWSGFTNNNFNVENYDSVRQYAFLPCIHYDNVAFVSWHLKTAWNITRSTGILSNNWPIKNVMYQTLLRDENRTLRLSYLKPDKQTDEP